MKVLACLLVLICQPYSLLEAQDLANVKEPEEFNQFFFLDSTGEIRPIERQIPEALIIQGNRSAFRLVQGEPVSFVVKLMSQDADPVTSVQFVRLGEKGEDKVPADVIKRSKKDAGAARAIPFEATAYGESSFKIKPKADLGPGEYVLKTSPKDDGYCFGVDAVKKDLK